MPGSRVGTDLIASDLGCRVGLHREGGGGSGLKV